MELRIIRSGIYHHIVGVLYDNTGEYIKEFRGNNLKYDLENSIYFVNYNGAIVKIQDHNLGV